MVVPLRPTLLFALLYCLVFVSFTFGQEKDGYEVQQIHLAQGKTPNSMTISWVTKESADTTVMWGTASDSLTNQVTGYTTSYHFDYTNYGYYQSGVIHHASIENLKPSTVYYYQVGDFKVSKTSGIEYFKTLPEIGDLSRPVSFAVLGDLGTTVDSESTVHHILDNQRLQLILHVGDLSYADCNQTVWDEYGVMIEDLSKERPWMVCAGNHEIEYGSDGSTFLAFEERYKMPAIKPMELGGITIQPEVDYKTGKPYCSSSTFQAEYNYGNSFYSFDASGAHMIFLNPYSVTNSSSPQYQWLVSDLKAVNRTKTPWIIVIMHCPFYNSNTAHHDEVQALLMKASMEPLFYQYHVNIAFQGHVHAYERTHPVYVNETKDDGVIYITIGDGGNREGHAASYYEPAPSWAAFRNGTQYGHGEITIVNKDKMIWTWNRNVDGEIIHKDSITICNSYFGGKVYC